MPKQLVLSDSEEEGLEKPVMKQRGRPKKIITKPVEEKKPVLIEHDKVHEIAKAVVEKMPDNPPSPKEKKPKAKRVLNDKQREALQKGREKAHANKKALQKSRLENKLKEVKEKIPDEMPKPHLVRSSLSSSAQAQRPKLKLRFV
jgi:hypothetical protein